MTEKVIPYQLSSTDKTVNIILNEAVSQSLGRLGTDRKLLDDAQFFLLSLTGETFLYSFLTPDGIETYRNKVFTNANARDLIFSVYSAFVARYSNREEDLQALNELIARSGALFSQESKNDLMPEELSTRMMTYDEILELLNDNPWIVSISLILMYWNQGVTLTHAKG